jgi:hypothetical protein
MVCNYDISHILKPLKSSLTDACAHIYTHTHTHTHTGSFTFVVICFMYNVSYIQYIDPNTFPVVHSWDVTCSMNNKDDKSFLWAWSNENKNAILVHFMHLEISKYFQCLWNSRQECNNICQWFFYAPNPTYQQTLEMIRIHAWVGRHRPSFILLPKLVGTLNLLTATLKVKWKVNQTLPTTTTFKQSGHNSPAIRWQRVWYHAVSCLWKTHLSQSHLSQSSWPFLD